MRCGHQIRVYLSALLVAASAALSAEIHWMTDYESARNRAEESGKPIYLYFSGSDWCLWCKKLERNLFASATVQQALAEHWVAVKLDETRRRRMPKARQLELDRLKNRYMVKALPAVIALDAKTGNILFQHQYITLDPSVYAEKVLPPESSKPAALLDGDPP